MSSPANPNITSVLKETRSFPPPPEFAAKAAHREHGRVRKALAARQGRSRGLLGGTGRVARPGCKHWDKVLVWNEPHAQWFVGGKLNVSANCLDRHLDGPRRNKAAIIWEGEPGDSRVLTYQMLHREVCKFANVLKEPGNPGRATASPSTCRWSRRRRSPCWPAPASAPSTSVIFGGFSADAVADRNNDAQAKLVVTADGGWRRGKVVPLKQNVDAGPGRNRPASRSASSSTAAISRST